ncbi:hypothetical protein JOQ06_007954, partial [Pogonophryne albipinna]
GQWHSRRQTIGQAASSPLMTARAPFLKRAIVTISSGNGALLENMEKVGQIWLQRSKGRTYVKTKNREVEPTRRTAAVHTGMKALGFRESAPLAGILSSPVSSELSPSSTSGSRKSKIIVEKGVKKKKIRKARSGTAHSRIPSCPSVPQAAAAQMPPLVYPNGGAFTHGSRGALLHTQSPAVN